MVLLSTHIWGRVEGENQDHGQLQDCISSWDGGVGRAKPGFRENGLAPGEVWRVELQLKNRENVSRA